MAISTGWQDGCAPPPFTEKLATYRVRINHGIVEVDPRPLPPGTPAAINIPREAISEILMPKTAM